MDFYSPNISRIIDYWIEEDIGKGDLTSSAITENIGKAHWLAKEKGIFCGVEIIKTILNKIDENIDCRFFIKDGETFLKDQKLLELCGPSRSLLASERISLNISMHLSGISTYTKNIVDVLKGTNIKLADTRKTTPGLRIFEKYAFKCGGGINHRMGLYDAAMIKENHIAWTDNLNNAVKKIRLNTPFTTHIIIEAENMKQAKDAVLAGADSILLDEFNPELLEKCIKELRELSINSSKRTKRNNLIIEVSGINPRDISNYLIDGVDFISTSSSITKSNWIDFSMRYIN
ncbi:Nicotinate-nucleotide pyrophosphorylase:Quinolinate phosphoriobsyl transferase [Prochlorococcus marinus str. MIT 9515]|uniref:Probable nicotinate-nucleotide pyrophosphorylase [carboxylating] n=1 Tax=Prochlorococcus marinus (strain MIT 9515) TaxID=167542 RepID=A2BUG5_PROM5|nr:carboxylating nicotinate-nucleotide diphosphorylase [Prochlorococcus marinus]ABM71426.1 Nicotinate-nucleotide pyrophosphorylase:Quinolinate phosphoriobsyl transferase [Prochlorococcus marinus str. MIT 9515]